MILGKLGKRELEFEPNLSRQKQNIYENCLPNKTSFNVLSNRYPSVLKRFSPCGKYLISFGMQQKGIVIYSYNPRFPSHFEKNCAQTAQEDAGSNIHQEISNIHPSTESLNEFTPIPSSQVPSSPSNLGFSHFFELHYQALLTCVPELLSSDFCLFTADKNFMILASALPSSQRDPRFSSVSLATLQERYPSSLQNVIHSLDDISFWIVEIKSGTVMDKFTLLNDYVYLTQHSGVSLYKNMIAITSVQTQTIHIMHISSSGKFIPYLELGWHVRNDDALFLSLHEERQRKWMKMHGPPSSFLNDHLSSSSHDSISSISTSQLENIEPTASAIMSQLKQRIMSFLFRKAYHSSFPGAMAHYYLTFDLFLNLIFYRMQFLDDDTILIKYGPIQSIATRTADQSSSLTCFYVVYSLSSTEVVGVFENGSTDMLALWERYDCLRGVSFPLDPFHSISTVSNNKYARSNMWKGINAIRKAKNGGHAQSIKRVLTFLPQNPQSYSESPYFDLDLFSYDEKVVSSMERIRPCLDYPCKFFDRKTGRFKFKLNPNPSASHISHRSQKRSALYLFHPFEPLVISIQHSTTYTAPNVNIHYRI